MVGLLWRSEASGCFRAALPGALSTDISNRNRQLVCQEMAHAKIASRMGSRGSYKSLLTTAQVGGEEVKIGKYI